ncbi:MAG: hypothetical protein HBSAPP03_22870 [Phycisphaerae bacterium]|nr:MAG: hypothetical protein HBSAPP03_22870 [Phycisphaerae bacterium]
MSESYRALCSDFYVNMKLNVRMELPRTRETVLDLFERVRRQFPHMGAFRKYRDELALESPQGEMPHQWIALRASSVRSGVVNPTDMDEGYALHRHLLELAPTYLSISPLDVDYIELLYGFDLQAGGNHDAIVLEALIPGSPLAALIDIPNTTPIDCQPLIGLSLGKRGDVEAYFEVKTRPGQNQPRDPDGGPDPISVYCTLRKFGGVQETKELPGILARLAKIGEDLVQHRVVPGLIVPIREVIASGNA